MHYNDNVESNLAERLKGSLSAPERDVLMHIAHAAGELGLPLYVVGGLPRDLILGIPSSDFDLVVEGSAGALAQKLADLYGGRVTVYTRFGTAKWDLGGTTFGHGEPAKRHQARLQDSLDFVTARSETYKHPAALPTVKAGNIHDDLRRRDFSINALAIRLDEPHLGELRDDFGGLRDLEHGIVRVLHSGSFTDDPTRMYRAVRYEQRYGFRIAAETLGLVPGGRAVVQKLSAQRVRRELELIMHEEQAAAMLGRLAGLDLLHAIHPALFFDEDARGRLSQVEGQHSFAEPEWHPGALRWLLWLLALPAAQIRSLDSRLHFRAEFLAALLAASKLWEELGSLKDLAPSGWVERLDAMPLIAVTAVYRAAGAEPGKTALERYLIEWRHLKPRTTGHDLKKLGLEPGPEYKSILRDLRRGWLDGELKSEQDERQYLLQLLGRQDDRTKQAGGRR